MVTPGKETLGIQVLILEQDVYSQNNSPTHSIIQLIIHSFNNHFAAMQSLWALYKMSLYSQCIQLGIMPKMKRGYKWEKSHSERNEPKEVTTFF